MTYNIHKNSLLTLACIVALACMTANTAFAKGSKGCKGSKGSKGSNCQTVWIEEVGVGCTNSTMDYDVLEIGGRGLGPVVKLGRASNPVFYILDLIGSPTDTQIQAKIPKAGFMRQGQYLLLVGSGDVCATGKPTSLTFEVTGGACTRPPSTYAPGTNKFKCEGTVGTYNGPTVFTKSVTGSSFTIYIGKQKLEIHTSCSADLNVGDQFGALKLVGFTGGDSTIGDEFDMIYNCSPQPR